VLKNRAMDIILRASEGWWVWIVQIWRGPRPASSH
jgi:hypothetical protein